MIEWIDDSDKFIIVTSLKNRIDEFSFDQSLISIEDFYYALEKTYTIDFPKRLIQINLPKYLSKDYLANVVLYHELGHFVDLKYRISEAVTEDIKALVMSSSPLSPEWQDSINKYFPYLLNISINLDYRIQILRNHVAEYFSDLFASQYIEKASNYYLDYVTYGRNQTSESHPSTTNRVSLVEAFLQNANEPLINELKKATLKASKRELKLRFTKLSYDDFLNLLPFEIQDSRQLSSLFIMGWDLWLNSKKKFKSINKMEFDLKPSDAYQIINSLIEKSISNYVVKTSWVKSKKDVSM